MTPARKAPRRGARAFAATWWGQAWIDALEASTLDAGRLSRGRTYARKSMVHPVTCLPGALKAQVEGSTPWPYDAAVHVPVLTDTQWDTLLDAVAARAGHTAALLDGEMPEDLVADAASAGVPLLPQPHELDPECSCPDWGYPCKHAAAVCYATATHIDEDPFLLFTLRGRPRDSVLTALRTRRRAASTADPAAAEDPGAPAPYGVLAREAFTAWDGTFTPPSPEAPDSRDTTAAPHTDDPGHSPDPRPAPLTAEPPHTGPVTLPDLTALMRDTAQRARRLADGHALTLHLDTADDAVRIAAAGASEKWFHRLVTGTGSDPAGFARLVRAAHHGGVPGITTARTPLTPDPAALAAARTALAESDEPVPVRTWRNRLTLDAEDIQLRHGPDGRWHPYARETLAGRTDWWPCAPAHPDPLAALTSARTATGR